jgi:hypothetical protein
MSNNLVFGSTLKQIMDYRLRKRSRDFETERYYPVGDHER